MHNYEGGSNRSIYSFSVRCCTKQLLHMYVLVCQRSYVHVVCNCKPPTHVVCKPPTHCKLYNVYTVTVTTYILTHLCTGAVATRGSFFRGPIAPYIINLVDCGGNESSLLECPYSTSTLFCFGNAGVICPTISEIYISLHLLITIVLCR